MREDSYTAREISQRVIDPADHPAGLPPNLPYPQLQQVRTAGSGMRSSPSMASMTSMASTSTGATAVGSGSGKKGFFSALRSKKDSGGLGPPTGAIHSSTSGSIGKKDVRGLQISNPERTSFSGPTPLGPRGPRMGSFTPDPITSELPPTGSGSARTSLDIPYRSSLDNPTHLLNTPLSARASLDSGTTQRTGGNRSMPPLSSGLGPGREGGGAVKEEDVRGMQDVLPHVEKGVLRAYLAKYGDQMNAIS